MKKLYRSKSNKKIFGIAGGLGDFFQMDPTIIRLIIVALCVLTGIAPLIIVYLIFALIIPVEPLNHEKVVYPQLFRSKKDKKIAGICSGFAKLMEIDPTIVRVCTVLLCILTGFLPLLTAYLIGWIIIPKEKE
jgi:phage shock protein PspC (stress-responsive transcriptional regulator)